MVFNGEVLKYPVSNAARRLLMRENESCIGWGCKWLHCVYDACFPHNRNIQLSDKWEAVLNAIDREKKTGCNLFEKGFYLTPYRRWARNFTLKYESGKLNL